ncbi:MAG: helix-turn-helix domain-containing protein [Actinomycetota bacterium]
MQADLSPRAGIGPALRRAREARGVSLDAASRSTRIRPRYLAALEDDAGVDAFPGSVYERFFLKEYARYLGVEDEPLVTALDERTAPAPPPLQLVGELQPPRRWVAHLVRVIAAVTLLGLVGYTALHSSGASSSPAQTARQKLTQAPAFVHRSHASVGTPNPAIPIKAVIVVRTAVHMEVLVNGEKAVKRTVQPRRMVLQVPRVAAGDPTLDVTVDDGSAVRLVVNGHVIPTAGQVPFHATFDSSYGRTVRL